MLKAKAKVKSKKKLRLKKPITKQQFSDPWINEWSAIDPAKEHALGVLTLGWNACEIQLLALFVSVARLDGRQGWIITHDLSNIELAERVLETAKYRHEKQTLSLEALEDVRNALRVFDACRQNRNSFTHFVTVTSPTGARELFRMRGPSMYRYPLPNELESFRRVATEARQLAAHLVQVREHIEALDKGVQSSAPNRMPVPALIWNPKR